MFLSKVSANLSDLVIDSKLNQNYKASKRLKQTISF